MIKNNIDIVANSTAVVLTAIQTQQTFQIISLVLTIISIVASLAFNIWKWYKVATKDKKITPDEIDELHGHINNAIDDLQETMKDEGDKKE